MLKFFVLVFLTVVTIINGRTSSNLRVQLPNGSKIVGRYLTSDSGKGIRGFLGVPYAEPPIDDLRFQVRKPYSRLFIFCVDRNMNVHEDVT